MHPPTPTHASPAREFTQLFSFTRRGARLARLMGTQCLADWGWPRDSDASHTAALIVGELAANAALHGRPAEHTRSPGFYLHLALAPDPPRSTTLRIEVTDSRGELRPAQPEFASPDPHCETGRGLPLVAALATRWGCTDHPPASKITWAELDPPEPNLRR